MNSQNLRLSRIAYPRSSLAVTLLLVAFFLGFGVIAEATMPAEPHTASTTIAQSNA